jgi:hypothetical protein
MAAADQRSAVAHEKLIRYTVRPCLRTSEARPNSVILVPPRGNLAPGFEMAKAKVDAGIAVRLVGIGVTLRKAWPSWVTEIPGLWLTELTAYRTRTRWEATAPLRESLKALADEIFVEAFPGLRGSEVFYPHIGMRAFAATAFVMPIVIGLAEQHAGDSVICTESEWPGFVLYGAFVGLSPLSRSKLPWAARLSTLAILGWAASLVRIANMYVRSRVGLDEIRRRGSRGIPRLWVHMFPDWFRINAPLIEGIRGNKIGVLLHGYIGSGERDEAQLAIRRGGELWPGLRGLDGEQVDAWGTTSIPPSLGQFGASCLRFTKNCSLATVRMCQHGPLLKLGAHELDLTTHAYDLVKHLTIDMARVCMADLATSDVLRHRAFRGTTILLAGAHHADVALMVRRLQRAGATTIDFAHGWSGEPMPFVAEPPSRYRCVWTRTDAIDSDTRFVVGGMATAARLGRLPASHRTRVLLLTNYAHRDDVVEQTGLDPYQDELLEIVRLRGRQYAFRWRPHPADRPEAITPAATGLPAELSRGRPLAEDLAWADVVVSTISTAVLEALVLDLPVLVHATPDLEDAPVVAPFSPQRVFFYATDGVRKLDAIVNALSAPDLLKPERQALAALFGETGRPRSLADAIAPFIGDAALTGHSTSGADTNHPFTVP